MLGSHRNKPSAKHFFKKALNNEYAIDSRVINIDKSQTFPPTLEELQRENVMTKSMKIKR
jgi:transposase-like protein